MNAFAGRYSRQLLETVDHCMRMNHLERPQSVLSLQKLLAVEGAAVEAPSLLRRLGALLSSK